MIYVGIDIAKLNHFATAISSDGEVLLEPLNLRMTMMASVYWLPNSILLRRTSSSLVLNLRLTMATTF